MKQIGAISFNRVVHEMNKNRHYLARVRYPLLLNIPLLWPDIFRFFEGYKPYVVTKRVIWQLPYHGWFKYNTDGASRGNPGRCSYGFCVRDCARELVYAKAIEIGLSKNIIDEAKTIVEGFYYCVDMQLYPLIIGTNLLVMKRTIDGEWNAPWCIGKEMKRINEMKDQFNVIFQHILREGNAVTEF
ncbi:uncharacterized protein LOC142162083 [Nicotiana tabacum]|uniref:Uncharacterized protein LOC142162083 n=1 Tax=Nicotiana tabacum TaxID=4097 RepID=A0AC58RP28_TOBAC